MSKTMEKVEELRSRITDEDIQTSTYTLADAIVEGATTAPQANGWGDGETQCALHSAVVSAVARNQI